MSIEKNVDYLTQQALANATQTIQATSCAAVKIMTSTTLAIVKQLEKCETIYDLELVIRSLKAGSK